MKRKPLMLTILSAAVVGAIVVSSCKKEQNPASADEQRAVSAFGIHPASPVLSGVLGTGHLVRDTIHLTAGQNWQLSGLVYVDTLDVLYIDSAVVIKGIKSTTAGVPGGGLVITRGAKIEAKGTPCKPIIFTSNQSSPVSGDWSGIIILGRATSNNGTDTQIEGIPSNPPASARYGGNVDNDNSGTLQYVRIEYAGFELSTDNEINALTFGAVGSGTTVDHVEAFKSNDDSFEWFGGTVSANHLVSVDALDDMFDTDNGFRGTINHALGLADTTRADKSDSNGFESDNNAGGSNATPRTNSTFNHVTLVGVPSAAKASITNGQPSGTGKYGRAAHIRRGANMTISNSIFMGYNNGIQVDSALGCSATVVLSHNFVQAFTCVFSTVNCTPATNCRPTPAGITGLLNATPNSAGWLTSPFNRASLSNFAAGFGSATDDGLTGAFDATAAWNNSCSWIRLR